jgi:uncharacterized protein YxjI
MKRFLLTSSLEVLPVIFYLIKCLQYDTMFAFTACIFKILSSEAGWLLQECIYQKGDYPMRYLIHEELLAFGKDSLITNEKGQPVFDVDGKALSVFNTLVIRDMEKNKIATIKQKLLAISPMYEITREGQEPAKIHKQLISPLADHFTVEIPGPDDLHIKGSLSKHEYTISRGDQVVATVSKSWFRELESYGVGCT